MPQKQVFSGRVPVSQHVVSTNITGHTYITGLTDVYLIYLYYRSGNPL